MDGQSARLAQLAAVLDDRPAVHEGAPTGVWGAARSCYEFIARTLAPDAVTLETGLGISTILFGMWSRRHMCVVGSGEQVAALQDYARERQLDLGNVRFEVGPSDQVLPSLDVEPLDLYLIDGGHGFPQPTIDWYYGSLLVRPGGIVVIDDLQLPSVQDYLVAFLRADSRWSVVGGDRRKWVAFRKEGDFSVREEWTEQPFLGAPRIPWTTRVKIVGYRQLTKLRRRRG